MDTLIILGLAALLLCGMSMYLTSVYIRSNLSDSSISPLEGWRSLLGAVASICYVGVLIWFIFYLGFWQTLIIFIVLQLIHIGLVRSAFNMLITIQPAIQIVGITLSFSILLLS